VLLTQLHDGGVSGDDMNRVVMQDELPAGSLMQDELRRGKASSWCRVRV
jgi:hypothetical protein